MPRDACRAASLALSLVLARGQAPCRLPLVPGAAACGDGLQLAHGEACVPTCTSGSSPSTGDVGLACDNATLTPGGGFSCVPAAQASAPSPASSSVDSPRALTLSFLCHIYSADFHRRVNLENDHQSIAIIESAIVALLPHVADDMVAIRGIEAAGHSDGRTPEGALNITVVVEGRTPTHLIELAASAGRIHRSTLATYLNAGFTAAGLPYDVVVVDFVVGPVPDICMVGDCADPFFVPKQSPAEQCAGESCMQSECCDPLGTCDPEDCQAAGFGPKEDMPEHCAAAECLRTECCVVLGLCWSDVCERGFVLKDPAPILCNDAVCTSEECCDVFSAPYDSCSCEEGFALAYQVWRNGTSSTNDSDTTHANCSVGLIAGPGCSINHCCVPATGRSPGLSGGEHHGLSSGGVSILLILGFLTPCVCAALLLYVQNRRRKRAADRRDAETSEIWDEKQAFSAAFSEQPFNVIPVQQGEATGLPAARIGAACP